MSLKKIGKALLFPHISVLIILVPIAIVFLVCSMIFYGTKSVVAIISYVLAAYTLTVWCFKIPYLIKFFKAFKKENKYARIWRDNTEFRIKVSLYGTLIYNTVYALLHLGMGFWHQTFWFYSLAGYYLSLAVMRFFLVRHTSKHMPGENMLDELKKYRACGIVFLIMNLALTMMIFFMLYWNRTFNHHEITTIALAAYTFTSLTFTIINTIKYRKYNSPIYSASKAISLASACVSLLILEATMSLTGRRVLLGVSGGIISVFIIVMAIYMILQANKKIKLLKSKEKQNGK